MMVGLMPIDECMSRYKILAIREQLIKGDDMTYGDLETMFRPGTYNKVGDRVCQLLDDGNIKLGTVDGEAFQCSVGILQKVRWDEGCLGFIYVCHLRDLVE